ncbi:CO/xanthine dehydrogenase Mo-binding subunit [Roseiarcus fermentans]|uniref:CO/xanthine dehydrogenase Mo-binding subunit n=1 Tax=Roseiarcus fermentans TaxID=1473586 RepID=A0A366FE44_9HYPH|nr:molybdopterin cofactor-binding domain-containing protein [Roseiarcus fermentans]RBP12029.1 CO/xanthine dehydrogenase Mo-binding subunit [Roseiarcus fermentans]
MPMSRRNFVRSVVASGITLSFTRLAGAAPLDFDTRETMPGRGSWNPAIHAAGRIDGVAKVTGAKLYASDFRAGDMPGWPSKTAHALMLRAADATHVFRGLDLSALGGALAPTALVTAADVARIGVRVPAFYEGDLFCPVDTTPLYLGQPLALLVFADFDLFDQARMALRDAAFAKFGEETAPVETPGYGAFRFTRVGGPTPEAPDVVSPVKDGWVSPGKFETAPNGKRPIWARLPIPTGQDYARVAAIGEQIRADLATHDPAVLVLDREFRTQSVDPMFLEPESALAWYDAGRETLELVLGVQSPYEAADSVAFMLGAADQAVRPKRIAMHFASCGGGFGGRDHTPFPLYAALAAMFVPDRPVRLANTRFDQFQSGVKRHAFAMRTQIGVERATGKIVAFAADHALDGGGLANFSANVATVGANAALGIYYAPKADITTYAFHSRGVTAGSMRGYGTVQTMTALETLVDEICATLPLDPIAFRRRNALATGGKTLAGNAYIVSVRTPEILDKLEAHPIWRDRADARAGAPAGVLVGTGVACAAKDYGSGADCSLGSVAIDARGMISIACDSVEMGNGIGTAAANRVAAHLGRIADEVATARIDAFDPLGLVTSSDPYRISQEMQDAAQQNPRWVPAISSASTASIGAHVGTHAAAEAARIVFRYGLWPAALDLWRVPKSDPLAGAWRQALWKDGELVMPGLAPLALADLAARAHAQNGVTAAMTHGFNRWAWSSAAFRVDDEEAWSADIDALAVRRGSGDFVRLDRSAVAFPPTDYNRIGTSYASLCGALVRVEVERATGAIRIARAYSVLECGRALAPEIVIGQAQGGFAMGVGYALLESLPPYEGGPGDGTWNLGRYLVARASDLPLHALEVEVLAPVEPDERPKGMAEVVMIPVVPALLNAIFDATGCRFRSLPVTQAMLADAIRTGAPR